MKKSSLDPVQVLDSQRRAIKPSCGFDAGTLSEAKSWQIRTRRELSACLAIDFGRPVPLRPTRLERVDRGSFIREKILIQSTEHSSLPVYVLYPKKTHGKLPCVLALHGHGYGVKDVVGLWEDGTERHTPREYQFDFAVALAEQGFLVVAPEISCFGERQASYSHMPGNLAPSTCHNASTYAMMLGRTMPGIRVWDAMRVVDYLETLPQADVCRLGVMGISGGGMNAFFSACLDIRIKAAVISGYFCDWRKSILALHHCTCNFVPGLLQLGELSDLAGLIAPRPLLVENGTRDDIFPIQAVKATVKSAGKAWRLFEAAPEIETDYFEGTHRINGVRAYPFLHKWLNDKE